jgi:alcohol dehydrogenase class IV
MVKNQILYSGDTVIEDFENLLKQDSPRKIFLVTGKNSYKKCGAELLFSNLLNSHNYLQFSDFTENPKVEDVQKGIELFRQNRCDYLLAIGGGSVIDMAKLINIGQSNYGNFDELILGKRKINNSGNKLVVIPTTSGAGSEATHFAVVYINSKKYSLAHVDYILPDCVFLVTQLTYSLSKYQTAVSGIDAFSQSIESYWSVNSNKESKKIAKEALEIIIDNLPSAVNNNDTKARDKMLFASYLSGRAINITKTTGAHAMSYFFTSRFNIPHGHAVALTLHLWYKINCNVNDENISDKRGVNYVLATLYELSIILGKRINEDPTDFIKRFINEIGLERSLSKLNIMPSDLQLIIDNINIERLENNPVKVTLSELRILLDEIY